MTGGILALDCATTLGWAVYQPGAGIRHGCQKFTGNSDGAFFVAYDQWLSDALTVHQPDALIFEAPFVSGIPNLNTARRLLGMASITDLIGHKREIRIVREVHVNTVKKHFTGSGRADKETMLHRARTLGFEPKDHNAADALAVLSYALSALHGVDLQVEGAA